MSPEAGEKPARRGEFKRKACCQDPSSRKRLSFLFPLLTCLHLCQSSDIEVHDRPGFWLPLPPGVLGHRRVLNTYLRVDAHM